ncbi:MAG: protein-disulfide reductase DsbD N-terminal domain-containing protein, partial [Gemmatimonadota bacterium]|nr:protein-disulfide reductase DsbD N-terminal domain-containing protein [Gemmatimonadota bacterium]
MSPRRLVCATLLFVACSSSESRRPTAPSVASFAPIDSASPPTAPPGGVLYIPLRAQIDSGWRIYSLTQRSSGPTPMLISASPSEYFRIEGSPQAPTPEVRVDSNFGAGTETYRGSPRFLVPVRVADATPPGSINLQLSVRS